MTFEPIRTERLLLRPVRSSDAAPLAERRSDPRVAEYQNWIAPYPLDRAEQMIAELAAMDGPVSDEWWMLTITDPDDTRVLGDLVIHPTYDGRSVEIGYTLAAAEWGRGYAVEALTAVVDRLWADEQVTRVHAMMHPDNVASAQVLERTGFVHEGHTKLSFWIGDDNSDDGIYGMTRDQWSEWTDRPRHRPADIRLVEIDHDNSRAVRRLVTHKSQERFVAPVGASFADALFPPSKDGAQVVPWMRAVDADDDLVGFVMMDARTPSHDVPYIWRLLIDRRHQRRGIGSTVLDMVIEMCREDGAPALDVSWVEGRGGPAPLYLGRGFVPTGDLDDGEIVARIAF